MTLATIDFLSAAGTAVLTIAGAATAFGIRWIHSKTQSSLVDRALTAVSSACHLAVTETWTGYVEALKDSAADGKLTAEERREARDQAIELAKSYLGAKGIALIVDGLGIESDFLDSFLGASIEASLADVKRAERAAQSVESAKAADKTAAETSGALASDPTPASAQA